MASKTKPIDATSIPPLRFGHLKGRLIRADLSYDRRAIFARAKDGLARGYQGTYAEALTKAWLDARRQRVAVLKAEACLASALKPVQKRRNYSEPRRAA